MLAPALHHRLLLGLLLVLGSAGPASGEAAYKIGDVATEDIHAPFQLVVIDAEQTAILKEREAAKVPVVFRYHTNAVNEVEQRFRTAFSNTRSNYLEAIEKAFNRQKLGTQALSSPKFLRTTTAFQKRHKGFPVSTNLAMLWASGESDRVLHASLAARLRETMSRPLRPAIQPPEIKLGYALRLVSLSRPDDPLTVQDVERRGRNMVRTNVMTLKRAREEFQQSFPPEDQALGKFLSGLLRTNCVPDMNLTSMIRAKRTESIWAADRYEPGQLVVARGQVIDKKIQMALGQLAEKTPAPTPAVAAVGPWPLRPGWMIFLGGMLGLAVVGLTWGMLRRRAKRRWLPVAFPKDQAVMVSAHPSEPPLAPALLPHLARLMMDKLVSRLLWQRSRWLESQSNAIAEMAELEERLEKIQAPLQDRLRAYEQRIGELEKQLAAKGEENRELIKTKLQLARYQLAATRNRLDLN